MLPPKRRDQSRLWRGRPNRGAQAVLNPPGELPLTSFVIPDDHSGHGTRSCNSTLNF
jgi:hypothetical protein